MEQSKGCGAILAHGGPDRPRVYRQSLYGRSVLRLRGSGLSLGLVSLLVALWGVTQPLPAQDTATFRRLTVRPREMATATRTERAGEYRLKPSASVYVPQQCVGTRRCPLLVFVWIPWEETMMWVRPMADKYGIILLGPGAQYYNLGANPYPYNPTDAVDTAAAILERQHLDATLKQVLQQFAIDPDKIAIMGTCGTGVVPVYIGGDNFDVFSRIISLSGAPWTIQQVDPPTPRAEFFFDAGVDESGRYFEIAQEMRRKGHRVTHAFGFRWHGHTLESYDHVGRWLQESWALPDPATRPAPSVIADPLPVLTTDVLTKMTAFWTRFVYEPDSIRMIARRAHLRPVSVPVGTARPVVMMTDMAALAARYPSVAAALKAAGLTAQEHDVYRVALASARAVKNNAATEPLDPASVQAKNAAFMKAHPDEFKTLEDVRNGYVRDATPSAPVQVEANMWNMP